MTSTWKSPSSERRCLAAVAGSLQSLFSIETILSPGRRNVSEIDSGLTCLMMHSVVPSGVLRRPSSSGSTKVRPSEMFAVGLWTTTSSPGFAGVRRSMIFSQYMTGAPKTTVRGCGAGRNSCGVACDDGEGALSLPPPSRFADRS